MLSSLVITLREGLEAALLVGIVLALLVRTGAGGRARTLWAGVGAALVVSLGAGALLFATGAELQGAAEVLFESLAMVAAAAILTWMIFWMRRRSRTMTQDLGDRVDGALADGGAALFWLGFVIVVREGLETALFLFASVGDTGGVAELAGALAGLAIATLIGLAAYRGSLRLDLRRVFAVLNVVLIAFGAYLIWGAVAELGELVGGEAAEIAGPVAAVTYLAAVLVLFRRTGRDERSGPERAAVTASGVGGGAAPRGATTRPEGH